MFVSGLTYLFLTITTYTILHRIQFYIIYLVSKVGMSVNPFRLIDAIYSLHAWLHRFTRLLIYHLPERYIV